MYYQHKLWLMSFGIPWDVFFSRLYKLYDINLNKSSIFSSERMKLASVSPISALYMLLHICTSFIVYSRII